MDSVPFTPTDNSSYFDYFSQFNSTDFVKQVQETPAIPYLTALASGAMGMSAFADFAAFKCVQPATIAKGSLAAATAAYSYVMAESKEVALAFAIGGAALAFVSKVREYEDGLTSFKTQKRQARKEKKQVKSGIEQLKKEHTQELKFLLNASIQATKEFFQQQQGNPPGPDIAPGEDD